jgi:hypothetical protein
VRGSGAEGETSPLHPLCGGFGRGRSNVNRRVNIWRSLRQRRRMDQERKAWIAAQAEPPDENLFIDHDLAFEVADTGRCMRRHWLNLPTY